MSSETPQHDRDMLEMDLVEPNVHDFTTFLYILFMSWTRDMIRSIWGSNKANAGNAVLSSSWLLLNALWSGILTKLHPISYSCRRHYVSEPYVAGENRTLPSAAEVENLMKHWSRLEELEGRLASDYGMTGDIDSVDVFDETKARAFSQRDEVSVAAVKDLYMLYRLRALASSGKLPGHSDLEHSPEAHHVDTSRFWVVLIGIDGYPTSPLRGCVNDALLMERFLVEDLGVPKCRIQSLLGSKTQVAPSDPSIPTRSNIIQTLTSLIYNSEIEHGDNIVIYFSGHGSVYSCEEYCGKGAGTIEALCPIDRTEEDDSPVPDISDREINIILRQIAHAKGHRITFILDCSHSGAVIDDAPGLLGKNIPPMSRKSLTWMLDAADATAKNFPEYRSVFAAEWCPDMTSHVILAACREHEIAKEERGETGFHGVFTESLVRTLRSGASDERQTYVDLVSSLNRSTTQVSAVAGRYKHLMLWYQNS
ncbi:caspase domain-containing protein [Armillaria nabsnona]|nr:caspase domain-containing protein [Armillaria nabsnona]